MKKWKKKKKRKEDKIDKKDESLLCLTISLYSGSVNSYPAKVGRRLVDVGLKGRPRNVLVVEGDVYGVVTGLGGQVGDRAGAVAVVPAVYGGLAGTLDGDPQATLAGASGVDQEAGWFVHQTTDEPRSRGPHPVRIAAGHTVQSTWTGRHGLAFEANADQVLADLGRGEGHQVALEAWVYRGLAASTGGRYYHHLDVRWHSAGWILRQDAKLLETVHGCGW